MDTILAKVWDGAGETWHWLRGVVMGEWEDHRSTSQIVTDALAGFVPGLGSIITLRDLIAVIVRLAKHPEKRQEIEEWILLIAMLLPLVLTAIGALALGVGALVGAELGGFLRALTLMLVKKGGVALKVLVEFFQHHGYGDVVKALRQVKFAKYKDALVRGLGEQIDKLIKLVKGFEGKLKALIPESFPNWMPGRQSLISGIKHCQDFVVELEALRRAALNMIPKALIELDQRLGALLAGDIKAATQATHTIVTGQAAPKVAKLEAQIGKDARASSGNSHAVLRNPEPPQPGNTRRMAERRAIALVGRREYGIVDHLGRPVGAKPYKNGVTKLEHPPIEAGDWRELGSTKVKDGWPNLANEYKPDQFAKDYDTFSGELRAATSEAGSGTTFKRLVSHDEPGMDKGAFYNRELPADGQAMRADSAIKEGWNKDGEYIEMRVPPKGDPVWSELNALQEKAAGGPVPYKEELKFWEGPAASQTYEKTLPDGSKVKDEWYLPGGANQQMFDREQMKLLKERGFVSPRKPTNYADFDREIGNIVPKDGPYLQIVPLAEAMPPIAKK
jgi:hypothetical protein